MTSDPPPARDAEADAVQQAAAARPVAIFDSGLGVAGWWRVGGHCVQYALMPWAIARASFWR